jgi:NADPH2:quinone reductase
VTVRMIIVYAMPEAAKKQAVDDINEALLNDALQHRIADTMPLAEIARSNEVIEQGSIRGAVILTIE